MDLSWAFVRLELVSFGWTFGPERTRGGRGRTGAGQRGSGPWTAALNLRKLGNPPAAMRRRGLSGLDHELQAAVWSHPRADVLYSAVLGDVQRLLLEGAQTALETDNATSREAGREDDEDEESASADDEGEAKDVEEEESDEEEEEEEEESEEEEEEEVEEDDRCLATIRIGLGCEKGKHRSVAVVERLRREASLQSVTLNVGGQPRVIPVEVIVRHRDIHKTGKDAQRGFKGRLQADARRRKRGHIDEADW